MQTKPVEQKKLIAWRRYYGLSQKEMAKKLGMDVRTYQNKEKGVSQFKANEMFAIAKILQKDISEIFLAPDFMNHEVDKQKKCTA